MARKLGREKWYRKNQQSAKLYESTQRALQRAGFSARFMRKSIAGPVIRSPRGGAGTGWCWARIIQETEGGWFAVNSGGGTGDATYRDPVKRYRSKAAAAREAVRRFKTCRRR